MRNFLAIALINLITTGHAGAGSGGIASSIDTASGVSVVSVASSGNTDASNNINMASTKVLRLQPTHKAKWGYYWVSNPHRDANGQPTASDTSWMSLLKMGQLIGDLRCGIQRGNQTVILQTTELVSTPCFKHAENGEMPKARTKNITSLWEPVSVVNNNLETYAPTKILNQAQRIE